MKKPKDKIRDNSFWTLYFNAFRLRCPVCKEGKIFPGWFTMVDNCPHCGIPVIRDEEQGYMLGSIYFNYGSTCVITMFSFVIGKFVFGFPDWILLSVLSVFIIVYPCFFLRYARASFLAFDQFFQPREPAKLAELANK